MSKKQNKKELTHEWCIFLFAKAKQAIKTKIELNENSREQNY